MFTHATSHQSGREKFTSLRMERQRKSLTWKAIRDTKEEKRAVEQAEEPP
jgi:hypothetical protein